MIKQICTYIGTFILSVPFVLFPILLGYGIAAHWNSFITFLLVIIMFFEFIIIWMYFIAEVSD